MSWKNARPFFGALMIFLVSCAMAMPKEGEGITVSVVKLKVPCHQSVRKCLVLRVVNSSAKSVEFATDGRLSESLLAEPSYSYEGWTKSTPKAWQSIALSIGDYVAPTQFVIVPPQASREIEVYFPDQLPTAWLYSKFRVVIEDRGKARYSSDEFDATGKSVENAP